MTDAERAFYKLLADLSSEGLFTGRPGTAERILDAFVSRGEVSPTGRTRWRAALKVNHQRIHIGYYDTPEEAAVAYDAAATSYLGSFACTNRSLGMFPAETTRHLETKNRASPEGPTRQKRLGSEKS